MCSRKSEVIMAVQSKVLDRASSPTGGLRRAARTTLRGWKRDEDPEELAVMNQV